MKLLSLALPIVILLGACSKTSSIPESDALASALEAPLVDLSREILEHEPHEDVEVAAAKIVSIYRAYTNE
jgi:hypothetical protein